jgi:hypothetical protein
MTRQEMFDKMVRGLAAQGWERSVAGDKCQYRGPGGRKCAVGQLIDDAEYAPESDLIAETGIGSLRILEIYPQFASDAVWLRGYQCAHDVSTSPAEMRAQFARLGERDGLTWPEGVEK